MGSWRIDGQCMIDERVEERGAGRSEVDDELR